MRLRLDSYLLPMLPRKPFSDLTTQDFLAVLRKVENRGRLETAEVCCQK